MPGAFSFDSASCTSCFYPLRAHLSRFTFERLLGEVKVCIPAVDQLRCFQLIQVVFDLRSTSYTIDMLLKKQVTPGYVFEIHANPVHEKNRGTNFSSILKSAIMEDNRFGNTERDMNNNDGLERRSSRPGDLPDSSRDREELENEETFIDLPDVKDIPGQEFVHAPPLGALGDTTIASDDEEGVGVFDLDDSEDFTSGTAGDVRQDERKALADTEYMPTRDENNLRDARMDNVDFQNEPLNERSFGEERSGRDLDIPGHTDETRTDAMGQGDEENKHYSLGSSDNDNTNEGTP